MCNLPTASRGGKERRRREVSEETPARGEETPVRGGPRGGAGEETPARGEETPVYSWTARRGREERATRRTPGGETPVGTLKGFTWLQPIGKVALPLIKMAI